MPTASSSTTIRTARIRSDARRFIAEAIVVRILLSMIFCLLMPAFAPLAFADTAGDLMEVYTDAAAPRLEQAAPSSGLHGIIGAGLFNGERIVGDTRRKTVPLPLVLLTYRDWAYWSIGGGGIWFFHSNDHSVNLGIGVKARPGYRPDDNPDLSGMEPRSASLDGFVNGLWNTSLANVGVRFYHDIGNVSRGDSITIRLSRNFTVNSELRLTPSIGVDWVSAKYVDYYYGIRQEEALSNRPAYAGHSALDVGVGLAGAYRIGPSLSLLGGFHVTRFGSGIEDSPIVTSRNSTLLYFGAGWMF